MCSAKNAARKGRVKIIVVKTKQAPNKRQKDMVKIRLALLAGGISGERNISLRTSEKIFEALNKSKYKISRYDPKTDLKRFFNDAVDKKFDLVFPALHGPYGEDGRLQGMLDMIGMPYIFSGCLASALAMDKEKSKIIAQTAGLDTAQYEVITKNKFDSAEVAKSLSLPVVIKPLELGSSVGISIAQNEKELRGGIVKALEYGERVLLEKFIRGRELTVPVMGRGGNIKALPVIEIIPKVSEWFDHKAKYEVGGSDEICPAKIPDDIRNKAQEMAVKIFKAIGCKDLARADFIWSADDDKLYFLEINTIPGMTATSLTPKAAKVAGMEFGEFLDKLIAGAF